MTDEPNSDLEMSWLLSHQIFLEADEGKKGFLSCDDIKIAVMIVFGYRISKLEAMQLLTVYGSQQESGDMGLDLIQFERAVTEKFITDQDEEIRHAFMIFDKHCRGFLTVEDMKYVFHQVCPHFPEHQLEVAFRELDRDDDGRISYKDFEFLMKFDHLS